MYNFEAKELPRMPGADKERATKNACIESESNNDEGVLSRGTGRDGACGGSSRFLLVRFSPEESQDTEAEQHDRRANYFCDCQKFVRLVSGWHHGKDNCHERCGESE